jgi:L-asparagine transporter-like permease
MAGFVLSHLFRLLSKDHPIVLNSSFLIPYFLASMISYLVDIADDYSYYRVHLIDQSKIWRNIIELRRALIPNYLLSVFLACIIIILYYSNNFRYLALALPLVISAVVIYSKFYAAYVKDRATKIDGQI